MKTFESFLKEKSLSDADITNLISRANDAVRDVLSDKDKKAEDKNRAKRVKKWISDVNKTFEKEKRLHPNSVKGLMRIVSGVASGRYGYSKSDYASTNDGSVPSDYRNK